MPNFSVNYSNLNNVLNKKTYKLSEVKDRLEKVAFDVVRFKDSDNGAELWQIQSSDDGDYIVSVYQEEEAINKLASYKSEWEVIPSKGNLNFFYKGEPILKTAASSLGLNEEDSALLKDYLPKKLSENKKLVSLIFNQLDKNSKNKILQKYPELA